VTRPLPMLDAVGSRPASRPQQSSDFAATLVRHGLGKLQRDAITTLQVNVGKLCNMACHHCHVEAGPKRTEIMNDAVVQRVLWLLERSAAVTVVDITGGAPELNPHFRALVTGARRLGKQVIDRCNLTVLLLPELAGMAEFLARERVRVVASLPCYSRENVDEQRGRGTFDKSLQALALLNRLGYGSDPELQLDLVYNPVGAFLPPPQARLQQQYKDELARLFGLRFDRLLTLANMPIKRFADQLQRTGEHEAYMALLVNHFNAATVPGLMCRSLLSIGWDGRLFDCDFNQMLELPLDHGADRSASTIWDLRSLDALHGSTIATGHHCFGCTAGAGSGCSGALT